MDSLIKAARSKGLLWRFIAGINGILNPDHAWLDYSDKPDNSLANKLTGAGLTGAEIQANEFSASEAEKQRQWEEQMSSTAYQRQVADMRAAGINPAMAMNGSGASTPSGSAATSVSPQSGMSMSDLMSLVMLPVRQKLLQSQAQMFRAQGKAAMMNAGANVRNAGTNELNAGTNVRNADTERFRAETDRMRYEVDKALAESRIDLNDEDKRRISEQAALLKLQREQLPKQLAIAQQNADSESRRALASLRQADAAVQNAATNDRLADYETSLKYAEELLNWSTKEGRDIVNKYLDPRQQAELENIRKEGVKLDKQGRLIDKQGQLVTAQMVKSYVNCATDVSGAVNQWINPLSAGAGTSSQPGFDLSGAYQGVAYGYD